MVLATAAFSGLRALEILVSIPILGMLGWFVNPYVKANSTPPDSILVLFIVSILAAAWALLTAYQFHRFRAVTGPFIALIDLAFVGAFIAGIWFLRGIHNANCGHWSVPVGLQLGDHSYSGGNSFGYHLSKSCTMLKVSWILAIVDCILFFFTFIASFMLYRSYKHGSTRTVSKEYSHGRRSGSTSTYSTRRHHRHSNV